MSIQLERRDISNSQATKENIPVKYGILLDTDQHRLVVLRFYHHQDLLDLILSDTYRHLVLYRTQYRLPTDDELSALYDRLLE